MVCPFRIQPFNHATTKVMVATTKAYGNSVVTFHYNRLGLGIFRGISVKTSLLFKPLDQSFRDPLSFANLYSLSIIPGFSLSRSLRQSLLNSSLLIRAALGIFCRTTCSSFAVVMSLILFWGSCLSWPSCHPWKVTRALACLPQSWEVVKWMGSKLCGSCLEVYGPVPLLVGGGQAGREGDKLV